MANPAKLYPIAHEQLTSTGTSDVKVQTLPTNTDYVLLTVETNDARITLDGSVPSTSNGFILPKGALPLYLPIANHTIQMVSTAAGASILNITPFVR